MNPQDVALSEPVFMRLPNRNGTVPTNVETVSTLMAGDVSFARAEPLALYWESYGFGTSDSLDFQLRVVRNDDAGVARRIGVAIGVASGLRDSISIKWSEPDARRGTTIPTVAKVVVGRAVAVDLRELPVGNYIVSIEVRRGASTTARSERRFTIKDR